MIKKYKKTILYIFLVFIAYLSYFYIINPNKIELEATSDNKQDKIVIPEKTDNTISIEILSGATFGALMATSGVPYATAMELYEDTKDTYDLVKIRQGRVLDLIYDKDTNNFKELRYKIDSEDELIVSKNLISSSTITNSTSSLSKTWLAKIIPIPYETKIKTVSGTIESSLYQAALDAAIDIRAIIELANAFQWTIDFAMDPRVGDTFKFIFEERFLEGAYVMPGDVLAGKYVNDGKDFYVYYFEEDETNIGFFDENGNSVQKMFLKAPVAFKYISSGFTTGKRYVEAFNVSTGHRAIDYAAPLGTPIRSVGNGTITFAGWSSAGYGYLTSIRHNGTYSTNYAHQSKILVSRGQKISQGDIIGKVGSTGFSTGPHLHYEMLKNGIKINPLKEVLPPGKPIKEENKARFFEEIEIYKTVLDKS